jgi:cytochrome bd-type quinol oxidase subunit 2
MKTSQIAAKITVRAFFILILAATIPYFAGNNTKLRHFNFVISHTWTLIFPALLIIGFLTLLITCTIKKYKVVDLNWLLVVNTLVLIAYGVAVFIRVYHAVS